MIHSQGAVKTSIIMPVYNGESFIAEAIDSILAQTMTNWELIIVNDGSSDATPDILAMYSDSRLTIIYQPNQGEAAARNHALDAACGEYLAFLDSDDTFLPNALESMTNYLEQHPNEDVVVTDVELCDKNLKPLMRLSDARTVEPRGHILESLLLDASVIGPPLCTMTRHKLIDELHLRFNPQLVNGPDYDFWVRLSVKARFGYLHYVTGMYRVHGNNISRASGYQRRREDSIKIQQAIIASPWFTNISLETRTKVFFHLLMENLKGDLQRQRQVLSGEECRALPREEQARLWRYVGIDALVKTAKVEEALHCLDEAVNLYGADPKTRLARLGTRVSPGLIISTVKIYRILLHGLRRIQNLGKRKLKAMPEGLRPTSP